MAKKKNPKKPAMRPVPPLSLGVLDEVQKLQRYAHQQLRDCASSARFNIERAKPIARTCAVGILDLMLRYYESLPSFDERWIVELRENAINSVVGMLPDGYGNDLYDEFYALLSHTTYDHLNPPKKSHASKEAKAEPAHKKTTASQLRELLDESHLTTEELAAHVEVEPRSVQRHLAGRVQPYPRHLRAYEKVFSKLLGKQIVIRKLS